MRFSEGKRRPFLASLILLGLQQSCQAPSRGFMKLFHPPYLYYRMKEVDVRTYLNEQLLPSFSFTKELKTEEPFFIIRGKYKNK